MKHVIIQVLPSLQQGGVERGAIEIAEALTKAGIENYVISEGGKMAAELEKLGVAHITLPVKTKNPFKMSVSPLSQATSMACLIALSTLDGVVLNFLATVG